MKKTMFLVLIITSNCVFSQNITGKIFDENNNPIQNVIIKSNRSYVHSDIYGNFVLENVPINDSITISHFNYNLLKMKYNGEKEMYIILQKKSFNLQEVFVRNLKHLNSFSKIDLELQPVATSQDLLRKVPGLFIGQHAGGGKAEQIFLRGFDLDHGTDIAISVDGMPVNMVSHAHGQGYADLHFLIPETVDKIDFDKGSYFVDKGDFTTAGYIAFSTKDVVEKSSVSLELGQFNAIRTSSIFNLLNEKNQSAYFATEYMFTDNYFDASQNFNRINLFGKYTAKNNEKDKLSFSLSHFTSKWDASGQIPERAVRDGTISHFGAIDSTEGGTTSRSNFNIQYDNKIDENTFIKNTAFINKYDFELFSNFTFFLNDPVNGDQIKQKENRTIVGFQSEYNEKFNEYFNFKFGGGLRNDNNINVELSHTVNRQTILNYLSLCDINQTNFFGYSSLDFFNEKWLINAALRLDYFKFNYVDKLAANYQTLNEIKSIVSPKLNFLYTQNKSLSYFMKLGKGFHSNDTRTVVAQKGKEVLPAAYSSDLGLVWKPFSKMMINTVFWYLFLEQEFVYVGDEAVVKPSGKTVRKGFDIGLRYQLNKWLFWNTDFTYTHARTIAESRGNDYLPLSPVTTFVNGLTFKNFKNFSGSIRTRYIGDRPANEDNSVIAKGYCITDFSINYQFRNMSLGINVDNILNTKWKETQFLTESRLYSETNAVEEIHYTPGTPFKVSFLLKYTF